MASPVPKLPRPQPAIAAVNAAFSSSGSLAAPLHNCEVVRVLHSVVAGRWALSLLSEEHHEENTSMCDGACFADQPQLCAARSSDGRRPHRSQIAQCRRRIPSCWGKPQLTRYASWWCLAQRCNGKDIHNSEAERDRQSEKHHRKSECQNRPAGSGNPAGRSRWSWT